MNHLKGRTVWVLGLGDSGLAMARWCTRHGASVRVWDSREQPPRLPELQRDCPQARFDGADLQGLQPGDMQGVYLILQSPGLAPHDVRTAPLLALARAQGIAVQRELDLFVRALADLKVDRAYAPQVLAITGTNGKTTTAALTALLVQRCGKCVALAGNIGPTLLDTLWACLDPGTAPLEGKPSLPEVWVLELSSFQLEGVQGFEPTAAALLNLSEDHLDWHGSMQAYAAAKARVFGPAARTTEEGTVAMSATLMVINRDDPAVRALVPQPMQIKGSRGRPGHVLAPAVLGFGLGRPEHPGDFGIMQEGGMAWLVRAQPEGCSHLRPRGRGAGAADLEPLPVQLLMPVDALRIRGRHNAANALAALALAGAIGCPLAPMLHGLREFEGQPHRLSFVTRVGEVEAFDDSKGTNVGATVAAVRGLGEDKAPSRLVLLLGGDGKGQDFSPLAEPVALHARAVALYGRDAVRIRAALDTDAVRAQGIAVQLHESLQQATRWAFAQARAGDAVLLSPACASLDQFRNYGHRAEVFIAEVQALAHDSGVPA